LENKVLDIVDARCNNEAVIDVHYRQPWTVIEPAEDPNLYKKQI